jgi:hypothetical protein
VQDGRGAKPKRGIAPAAKRRSVSDPEAQIERRTDPNDVASACFQVLIPKFPVPGQPSRRPAPKALRRRYLATLLVDALADIVRLNTRGRPGSVRAKGILIFRPNDSPIFRGKDIRIFRGKGIPIFPAIDIPNPLARVLFVVSGVVLGRHDCICHRRDNQSRAEQAKDRLSKDRLSHYVSPLWV